MKEGVWNQELAKALFGADSRNLKMRRLPPTVLPTPFNLATDSLFLLLFSRRVAQP